MEVGRHAGAQRAGATASASMTFCKKKRRSKREKEETEGERSIAEKKKKRDKHVAKANEDTARKGIRATDMRDHEKKAVEMKEPRS